MKKISKEEKLEALNQFTESMRNIPEEFRDMTIQKIKAYRGEKYGG